MCQKCRKLIKAIDAYLEKADNDLEEQLLIEGYLDAGETVKQINRIEEAVNALLASYGDNLVKKLDKSVDLKIFFEDEWPKIKRGIALGQQLEKVFRRELKRGVRRYAEIYLRDTDSALKLTTVSKSTTAWVKAWSIDLADIMELDTHTAIEKILSDGLEKGSSIDEISRLISESGIRNPGYRSRRVALTETLRAHSVAQQESFLQSPAVSEKEWRHTGAYETQPRKNHEAMDGQRVPKGESFTLMGEKGGIYHPCFPRDPALPPEESVNCHCIMQGIVNKEILGLSIEERRKLQQKAIEKMDAEWEAEIERQYRAKAGSEEIQ